jgi:hypothetical protein
VAYFSAAERRKDEDSISRSKKRQKAEQWGKTGIRRRGLASRYRARQVEVDDAKKNNCWQINRQASASSPPASVHVSSARFSPGHAHVHLI